MAVRRLLEGGSAVGLSEARLVERFADRRDEAAFEALVDRHGPMVLGVCRRLLRDPNDADDAFQATFLVLARKAGGLRRKELVANWLYGVALRVASEARGRARPATPGDESAFAADARRPAPADPADVAARREDEARLHEEVGRLPERYRAPVVACYFEGRTHEEAAALLDWPVGTVKGRLARARDLLRERLERRGVTAPTTLLASALVAPDLRAAVPPALASRALAAALAAVASPSAWMTSAALSTSVRTLSEGAIQAMFHAQIKAMAIPATLAVGLLAAGAGLATAGRQAAQEPGEPAAVAAPQPPPPATPTPAPAQEPPAEVAVDRPRAILGPMDVLRLIDETGKAVLQRAKEAEVDLSSDSTPERGSRLLDRYRDDVAPHIDALRSARVDDPRGRALLDAFADFLAPVEAPLPGFEWMPRDLCLEGVGMLGDLYDVFERSVRNARDQAGGGPAARLAAAERYQSTIAPILARLRGTKDDAAVKPLRSAYADCLEAIDPFAEESAFRRVSAEPAPPPQASPEGRSVKAVLDDVWKVVDQYQKSYRIVAEVSPPRGNLAVESEEALARHRDRVKLLEKEVRNRAGTDPLLRSLADYLIVASKPPTGQPEMATGPRHTFTTLHVARAGLAGLLDRAKEGMGPDPGPFERELARDLVAGARGKLLAESYRLAERDPEARDLLTRHAEYVTKLLADEAHVFPAPSEPPTTNRDLASIVSASPPAAEPARPAAVPDLVPGGGFGGGGGPSPEETRQKVAGLSATLASVDDDPNNRKARDALERPAVLKAEGNGTLREVIEQAKNALKAEDGSPIPVYVDPKGLEAADVTLDSPATIDLEGVPMKFSLRLVLKQLGLAYCVRDGVLIISSLEGIEQELLEAQREMSAAHPDRFILGPDGAIRPAPGMAQPGGMM
ncbi:RNA polymerase sigma factor [Paludisphaera sp.]|uniref:RNA polymerase sigma factor n=1 Tax=Paludisphaera sp. TaxID=2017432 RepID=UPI00301D0BB5